MRFDDYEEFCRRIDRLLGVNLLEYKENQMKRRLTTLYEKKGLGSFQAYYQAIASDQETRLEFLDRMTINVSEFFRNHARWEVLEKEILPALMGEHKRPLRVWSAACSTGEEPYSLAMLLMKLYPQKDIRIVATDIDEVVLERAKRAVYNEYAVKSCPKEYLDKHFSRIGKDYALNGDVKACVTFRKCDLLKDSFEKEWDLIVCRNVLIYFTEEAKEKMYHKFSASLRKGGVLFVGSTEQIFQPNHYQFETENTFFYRKMGNR